MRKIILLVFAITMFSCNKKEEDLVVLRGDAIGTTFTIRYLNPENKNVDIKIEELIKRVNKSISTYIPTSDISKINKGDSTIVIDSIFKEVFFKSEKIYKETKGEFDPTIGILVNAWGFGPGKRIENMDSTKVKELLKYVGFDKVFFKKNKIVKKYSQIYLDFNAIAKGYLVDLVGRMFEQNNIRNYMVEIGGEIRARGVNQLGIPWRIAIENPNSDGSRSIITKIKLDNESIATSGNYRKFRIAKNGKKYVHTINPLTGFAAPSNLLSASVISKSDCADVDGYATAFMAMGFEKAKLFLENHLELKAYLIYIDDKNKMKTYKTPNFKE
jgi:thiamine biosynthesis lipoprotein